NLQVPAVDTPPVTQRAGNSQSGPAAMSHAALSGAGATHVPAVWPIAISHVAPAAQRVSTLLIRPHGMVGAASGWATHCFGAVLQVRPAAGLQSEPVLRSGSQVAPAVVSSAVHVPEAVIVAPTHARPSPHG